MLTTIAGPDVAIEAALCFYRALKVYPSPADLISIYDKTVPKVRFDIAPQDPALPLKPSDVTVEFILMVTPARTRYTR